ncbi:MAG: hypothetical protein K6E37_04085 [Bacteroidales bacterium]|nr:hypothetical protein [Bacteroidales bacterium]
MKKLLFIASAFILAMTVSCNKAIDPVNPSENGSEAAEMIEFSFPATREMTKSYLDGNTFKWEMGDMVAVCYGSTVAPFKYDPEGDKFVGTIDAGATGPFSVIYPYNSEIQASGGSFMTTMPSVQVAGDHNVDPSALISAGQVADQAALSAGVTLKNVFTLFRVDVTDSDVASITLENNSDDVNYKTVGSPFAGSVSVDPTDGSCAPDSRNAAVTLKGSGATLAPGTYDIAVLPVSIDNGMKIIFKRSGEDKAYYKKSTSSKQLVRNTGLDLGSFNVAGIETRCWYIQDAADLQAWNSATKTAEDIAFLGEDIDMSGVSWSQSSNVPGTFDGQYHFIYNFTLTTNQYCGFIRTTHSTAASDFKNLYFGTKDGATWDGVSKFTHSSSANNYTWYYVGVVAKTQGPATMSDVYNFAQVEVAAGSNGKTRIGGVCGNWASSKNLQNCYNYGDIVNNATATGQNSASDTKVITSVVGGVVGQCDSGVTIENCANYGTVTNNNPYVKWVAGVLGCSGQAVTVKDCTNFGTITNTVAAYTSWLGTAGVAGYISSTGGKIINCASTNATITSVCHVAGGIAAQIDGGTIENCTVSASQISTSTNFPAGILAYGPKGGTVKNCKVIDNTAVSGKGEVGGICGRMTTNFVVTGCVLTDSSVSGTGEDVGGIVGWSQSGTSVTDCSVVNAKIEGATKYVAGIVGLAELTTVSDCVVDGSQITGQNGTGGIIGYAKTTQCSAEDCAVSGTEINGANNTGGIIGDCDLGSVEGCMLNGSTIKAKQDVGGIIGWLSTGSIKRCSVDNSQITTTGCNLGGIVGRAIAKGGTDNLIDKCFVYDSSITGTYDVAGIIGYAYPDENGPVNIYNCGVESVSVTATACDSGGDPTSGDSMSGLIGGWMRCSDAASSFKIVNCYSYDSSINCELAMAHPSVGGAVGYVSLSGTGTAEIANFSTDLKTIKIQGSPVPAGTDNYGAIAGLLPDKSGISVSNCVFIDGTDLTLGNNIGAGVVLTDNEAFAESVFTDGATVPAKLNTFASAYSGYTLSSWAANTAGVPVLN